VRANNWNIIGSPFLTSVKWSDVISVNSLPTNDVIYSYEGANGFITATTMEPFVGYYYFGNNLPVLKIPYPFTAPGNVPKQNSSITKIGIHYSSTVNNDNSSFIGIDAQAKEGFDEFELRKPPVFMDQGAVWFDKSEWDEIHPRFASDIRPALGEGQQWDLVVHHPMKEPGKISISGLEYLSSEYSALLIDNATKNVFSVILNVPIPIYPSSSDKKYSLIIGKQSYIQTYKEKYTPAEFALMQNYPNPFNPATTINYQLPVTSNVSLKIYDALGREVATLVNEVKEAGYYSAFFDATQFSAGISAKGGYASGVYFAKLQSGTNIQMKKMLLMK
jgi:hypothetical protein